MLTELIISLYEKGFSVEEICKINDLLQKGLFESASAEINIASIFIYARDAGKTVEEVCVAIKEKGCPHWDNQHPELRGNPMAPGGAGKASVRAFNEICEALGITSFVSAEIPKGALEVRTENAVYSFGVEDNQGIRAVSRKAANSLGARFELPCNLCKITKLVEGYRMEFDYIPENIGSCLTTPVQKIVPL